MGRTTVNLIGNCVATVVIARWENAFDYGKMKEFINETDHDKLEWDFSGIKNIYEKVTNRGIE